MSRAALAARLRSIYLRWYFLENGILLGPNGNRRTFLDFKNLPTIATALKIALETNSTSTTSVDPKDLTSLYLNGHKAEFNAPCQLPFKLEAYFKNPMFLKVFNHKLDLPKQIILSSPLLCIAYKPAGMPSLPLRDLPEQSAKQCLEKHLQKIIHFPSRLDSDTQGLLIGSCDRSFDHKLQTCFSEHTVNKIYLAQINKTPNWNKLEVNTAIGKSLLSPALRSVWGYQAKPARTIFTVITKTRQGTLLACQPITGRTHQIRVHLKSLGIEILNDPLYGQSIPTQATVHELNLICHTLQLPKSLSTDLKEPVSNVPSDLYPDWLKELDQQQIQSAIKSLLT